MSKDESKHFFRYFRLMVLLVCLMMPMAAFAQTTTVSANFSVQYSAPSHVGAGYLYGLSSDGTSPNDSLLLPLQCQLMRGGGAGLPGHGWIGDGYSAGAGFQTRMSSALSQARRMTTYPYHATYDLLLSDVYGLDSQQPSNTIYPCDNSNTTNYIAFIDAVVAAVKASGVYVSYDIQNEPDNTGFWGRGIDSAQYFQMWDTAVREIRRLQPNAWIIGPSFSNFYPARIQAWIAQVQTDGTLPTYLNWHFSDDVVQDGITAAGLLSSADISGVGLSMNECILATNENSGYTAWYMTQLSKSNIQHAAHAVWGNLYDGSLCQELVNESPYPGAPGIMEPTGQWWVMKRYGDMSGNVVSSQGNSSVDLCAATDSSSNKATILLGSSTYFTGVATVSISGLTSTPYLMSNNQTEVVVEKIPDTGQSPLSTPIVIQSGPVIVNNGQITVAIPWTGNLDAYAVTLRPYLGGASLAGSHTLIPMNATGSCLEASNWGTANGTKIEIWQTLGGSNQLWYFVENGDNSYTLSPSYAPGMCLDVSGFGTTNGTIVQLWQATGGNNQNWLANAVNGSIYSLHPGNAPGMCLDVSGLGTVNGTQVQIWQPTGASNQQWQIN